jgi:hypothetical protein
LSAAQQALVRGKWVEYTESASDSSSGLTVYVDFRLAFMHFSDWVDPLAKPAAGVTYAKGGYGTIHGMPAISLKASASEERASTIWVALRGEPYPLRWTGPGGSTPVDLTEHGTPVEVRKPSPDKIVTPDKIEAAAPAPTPGTGPLDGAATIPLHHTARLPRKVQVTFVKAGDLPTVKVTGFGSSCDGTGTFTTTLGPGSSTFACGMQIEVVAVDRGGSGRPPSIRIIYRPDR